MQKPIGDILSVEGPQSDPVEWWYWNGHLKDEKGGEFAYMLALFKAGVFGLADVYFTHWIVSDLRAKTSRVFKKTFWGGLDKGSFEDGRFTVNVGEMLSVIKDGDTLSLKTPDFDLAMVSKKPPLMAYGTGLVDLKSSTTVCYSLTRLETHGTLKVGDGRRDVEGLSWMDHQWSPLTLNREHVWTWFCFQLDDGTDVMCFRHGRKAVKYLAVVSSPDGLLETYEELSIEPGEDSWTSPVTGRRYTTEWNIQIPGAGLSAVCRAPLKGQEMKHAWFKYWEGPIAVKADARGEKIEGRGFLEMNGV
jgi:predicted secreted hydrolase